MRTLWLVTLENNPERFGRFKEWLAVFETEEEADKLIMENKDFQYVKGSKTPAVILKKRILSPFMDDDLVRIYGIRK